MRSTGSFIVLMSLLCGCSTLPDRHANVLEERLRLLEERWNAEPIPVGLERQVFYDDAIVASRTNTVRKLGAAKKLTKDTVIPQDKSWEDALGKEYGCGDYNSVLLENGLFRMWYHFGEGDGHLGYAESQDGLHWIKPTGLRGDNFVMYPVHGQCVIRDPHDTRYLHRYKMVYGWSTLFGSQENYGLTFAHSRNGTSWSNYGELNPIDDCRSDTANALMWDEDIGMYRVCTRMKDFEKGRGYMQLVRPYVDTGLLRLFAEMLFIPTGTKQWKLIDQMRLPKEFGQIYGLYMQKYGGLYIAYVNVLEAKGRGDHNDFFIAVSRNGVNWNYEWVYKSQPFIEHGGPEAFDSGGIMHASSPLITVNDRHWLYYGAYRGSHGSVHMYSVGSSNPPARGIGLAEVRLDGLMYLEAETNGVACVETKQFVWEGDRLDVNADASLGSLQVEVLDETMHAVEMNGKEVSDPIERDECHAVVRWGGSNDLAALRGKTIKLRFVMQSGARLYAFQVRRETPDTP